MNYTLKEFQDESPICSFLGGIIAQEALEFTGKFISIDQWFWCDFFETIDNLPDKINRRLTKTMYDFYFIKKILIKVNLNVHVKQ